MKNLFFAAAVAALACAGCAKEEIPAGPQDLTVRFSTEIAGVTRSKPTTDANFKDGDKFVVNATRKDGPTGTASAWITNRELTKTSAAWNWSEGGTLYFMKGYVYDFLAYAPASAALDVTTQTAVSHTVSNVLGEQVDLLYATATKDFTSDVATSTVDLTFDHALAQVTFAAKIAQDYAPYTATVTGVTLNKVNSKGTMDLTKKPVVWTPDASPVAPLNYAVTYSQALTTTMTDLNASDVLMLMPQDPAGVELVVTFDVTGGVQNGTGKTITIALEAGTKVWAAGFKYTYNITLKLDNELGWTVSDLSEPDINPWQNTDPIEVGN